MECRYTLLLTALPLTCLLTPASLPTQDDLAFLEKKKLEAKQLAELKAKAGEKGALVLSATRAALAEARARLVAAEEATHSARWDAQSLLPATSPVALTWRSQALSAARGCHTAARNEVPVPAKPADYRAWR